MVKKDKKVKQTKEAKEEISYAKVSDAEEQGTEAGEESLTIQ